MITTADFVENTRGLVPRPKKEEEESTREKPIFDIRTQADAYNKELTRDERPTPSKPSRIRFNSIVEFRSGNPPEWTNSPNSGTQLLESNRNTATTTEDRGGTPGLNLVNPVSKYVQSQGAVRSDTNMDKHKEVLEADKTALNEDWRDAVLIDTKYEHYKEKLIEVLEPFQSMWDGRIGTVNITKHRIELEPGTKPVNQQPYRAGPRQRELELIEIRKILEQDIIEPATSEWAAPIVFAPKKDGSLRFCIDYRRLNAATKRDAYPIPRMDECIDSLGDAQIFTLLDANSGYWQIELDEDARDLTAFVSHHGLFRYKRMPFGLKNAPSTFRRAIDMILATVKWQFAIVYLDDIIIFSRTSEEHTFNTSRKYWNCFATQGCHSS